VTPILGRLISCPVFVEQGTLLGEDSCVWTTVTGQQTNQYANGGTPGYRFDSMTYRLGGQKEFTPDWFLGGAFGVGTTWTQAGGSSTGHGQTIDGGVALKHTLGPWLLAGAIAVGASSNYIDRSDGLPGSGALLRSDANTLFTGVRLRGAYDFAFDDWYLRPRADLDVTYTHMPGSQVSGPSALALAVRGGVDKVSVVISPMLEIGTRYNISQTMILRPYAAVGASFLPNNIWSVDSSFVGPLAPLGSFRTSVTAPSVLGTADLGIQLYQVGGFEVKAEYTLSAGDAFLGQSVSLRGAYHF